MNGKYFVGQRVSSLETYSPVGPITGVALVVDTDNEYRAGTEDGYVMEIECPYGTQAMAENLLTSLNGKTYSGYRAEAAELAPEAELGDGITVGGVYAMLAYRSVGFGPGHMSEIAAPGEHELEHEYPYVSQAEKQIERKIATTRSMITKTAEEIRLAVEQELTGLSSSIEVKLGSITGTVQGLSGQVSTFQQTVDGIKTTVQGMDGALSDIDQKVDSITLNVSNGTSSSKIELLVDGVSVASQTIRFTGDVVFESDLASGNTTISGDCITTGKIEANRIRLTDEMYLYEEVGTDEFEGRGSFGYFRSYDFYGDPTYGVGIMDWSEENQVVCTDGGARLTSAGGEIVTATNITLETVNHINLYSDGLYSDQQLSVTSDRRKKADIREDVSEKYIALLDRLKPVSFAFTGKGPKRHVGFIAQDVEAAMEELGLAGDEFAGLDTRNPDLYSIAYSEFIAILVAKVKQLEKRLEDAIK